MLWTEHLVLLAQMYRMANQVTEIGLQSCLNVKVIQHWCPSWSKLQNDSQMAHVTCDTDLQMLLRDQTLHPLPCSSSPEVGPGTNYNMPRWPFFT